MTSFLQSYQSIALGVAVVIFLITVFLSARRIIGLIFTIILLTIAVITSLIISRQHPLPSQIHSVEASLMPMEEGTDFKEHILQAINHIHIELNQEKESLKKVSDGIQVLILQMETQKQKLHSFIDEAREKFSRVHQEPEGNPPPNEDSART
jgi:disulfide bond formation protein DsbB